MEKEEQPTYILLNTRFLFFASLIIAGLTILFVWLFGLGKHRTLFENTFFSTVILTTILFQFLFIGLYNGFRLKENLGRIFKRPTFEKPDSEFLIFDFTFSSELEAFFVLILSIPILIFLILNLAIFLWAAILLFIAILYWIVYRAIKFVLRKSVKCKNNSLKSLAYSFLFTLLYSVWFYVIIFGVHYFK